MRPRISQLSPLEQLRNLLIRLSEHWPRYRIFDWQTGSALDQQRYRTGDWPDEDP